jgi:rubrerythrin
MRTWSRPLQSLLWRDAAARGRRLLRFAEVEADGGRDLVRAAELTPDTVLRRLYLAHARDEHRHAELFRERGLALLHGQSALRGAAGFEPHWLTPGERGLDDLRVEQQDDATLLAFLHLSERAAARDFAVYSAALSRDPETRAVFENVLRDETFHMTYTAAQLKRVAPATHGRLLWSARFNRLWKSFLRFMSGIANLMGTTMLLIQYFVLLPPFVWLARDRKSVV